MASTSSRVCLLALAAPLLLLLAPERASAQQQKPPVLPGVPAGFCWIPSMECE